MSRSARSIPTSERRTLLTGVDPVKLSEILEEKQFEDPGSPFCKLYYELLTGFLAHDEQAAGFHKLLDAIDDGPAVLEAAMRRAGFVVGFECCRQLLLGELDIAALKGGAK